MRAAAAIEPGLPIDPRPLLACGVVATVAYAAADLAGGLWWDGYSFSTISISELAAITSPSRHVVVPLFFLYTLTTLAFGIGIWVFARQRALRVVGGLVTAIGVVDVAGTLFPMHLRGFVPTYTDTMHIVLTASTVALIIGTIVAGMIAIRGWFRAYSVVTLIVLVVCGALAGIQGGALAAGEPTPTLGLLERINVHGSMLWNAMLAVVLLRQTRIRS
jgi:hypothetical protein